MPRRMSSPRHVRAQGLGQHGRCDRCRVERSWGAMCARDEMLEGRSSGGVRSSPCYDNDRVTCATR